MCRFTTISKVRQNMQANGSSGEILLACTLTSHIAPPNNFYFMTHRKHIIKCLLEESDCMQILKD